MSLRAQVQAMLDVESALADVEARLGIIPQASAAPIKAAARAESYDPAILVSTAADSGTLVIPLVRQLTEAVATLDGQAARYVHWGATSQDIQDTALVLQLQNAVPVIARHLRRASSSAASHARHHIDTTMPGRTWLQQATPITFGLKAAGWLDALDRDTAALDAALEAVRVVQFGGASGTLAALGDRGPEVAEQLGPQLGLRVPDLPWHAHRDRLARLACMLGVACGTCGKIGRDLALLAQTEVAEASETRARGGGSSTMPHKSNPVYASVALAAAVRAPGLVATMLAAMLQEHERGLGGWQAEWTTLPELVRVTAGAARAIADALEGLVVNSERMRANVDITRGAILAESVAMALAPHIGRSDAHKRLEQASKRALRTDTTLAEALAADAEVTRFLTPAELQKRLSPEGYLGAARTFVERVLARSSTIDK